MGDEAGMKVGGEDVTDLQANFSASRQVLVDISLRIGNDGVRTGLVAGQIRGEGAHVKAKAQPRPKHPRKNGWRPSRRCCRRTPASTEGRAAIGA